MRVFLWDGLKVCPACQEMAATIDVMKTMTFRDENGIWHLAILAR